MLSLATFLLFYLLLDASIASVNHGTLCPGVEQTIHTDTRGGFKQNNWELFTFNALAGQTISIVVRRTQSAMDPILFLWNPSGALLAGQDDDVISTFLLLLTQSG